jgi:hypothetical protein
MYGLALTQLSLKAGQRVIDIGSTPDVERIDSNCIVLWLQRDGLRIALSSPEDISSLKGVFPFAEILPSNGFHQPVAARDGEFDLAMSSAVLEHCGPAGTQIAHIRECGRVAQAIFLTTPNRWHWLEFHTKLPFLHWLPKKWHRFLLRLLGLEFWAKEENLNLLDRTQVETLAQQALGPHFEFKTITIWTLGMPSNIMLLARRVSR